MPTIDVLVRRFSLISSRPFEEVVRRLTAPIGCPDMRSFHEAVTSAPNPAELEAVVRD